MLNINFTTFPTIETERLLLKEITLQDAADFFAIRSNIDAMKYIDRPIAKTIEDAEVLINKMIDLYKNNIVRLPYVESRPFYIVNKSPGTIAGKIRYRLSRFEEKYFTGNKGMNDISIGYSKSLIGKAEEVTVDSSRDDPQRRGQHREDPGFGRRVCGSDLCARFRQLGSHSHDRPEVRR